MGCAVMVLCAHEVFSESRILVNYCPLLCMGVKLGR